jgi:hypothetical protein
MSEALPACAVPIPSVSQEIERKALEQLEVLVRQHEHGQIADNQLRTAIDTLFAVTSGIVPEDVRELLEQTAALCDNASIDLENHIMIAGKKPEILAIRRKVEGRVIISKIIWDQEHSKWTATSRTKWYDEADGMAMLAAKTAVKNTLAKLGPPEWFHL